MSFTKYTNSLYFLVLQYQLENIIMFLQINICYLKAIQETYHEFNLVRYFIKKYHISQKSRLINGYEITIISKYKKQLLQE